MFCYFYIFSIINHSFGEMNHYNSRNWDQKSPKKMISRKSLGIFSLIKLIWKSTIASVKSKRRCWELLMNNTYKKVFLWKEKNMKKIARTCVIFGKALWNCFSLLLLILIMMFSGIFYTFMGVCSQYTLYKIP